MDLAQYIPLWLIGSVAVVFGLKVLWDARREAAELVAWAPHAKEAPGTITENWQDKDAEGRVLYHPWVRFRTWRGEEKHFRGDAQSIAAEVGSQVAIVYNDRNPDEAHIKGSAEQKSASWRFAGFLMIATGSLSVFLDLFMFRD